MIFVNFKTYPQATGKKAVMLAKICQEVAQKSKVSIIPCVQAVDLFSVAQAVNIPVWIQHIDPVENGKTTGYVTAHSAKLLGASGTLLNHSEHKLSFTDLTLCLKIAKKAGLQSAVLVGSIDETKKVMVLNPDFLGLEEASLIGGKKAMVSSETECVKIRKFIALSKKNFPLIGAGINRKKDVEDSLNLGAKGVLMASAVVLSDNPKKVLQELASAFHS